MTSKALIVDGTNLAMRAIFAMNKSGLSHSEGERVIDTGPTLSFINVISRYVRAEEPDYMVVCWDGGSNFRKGLFPEYKASRNENRQDLPTKDSTFDLVKDFLSLAGIHHVVYLGVEADDVVAFYWRNFDLGDVTIVSGDKDFLQLVGTRTAGVTKQIRPGVDPDEWYEETVIEKLGCRPEHLPDVMALAGDSVDGIPGVPRVAHLTAVKLLNQYLWSLDYLLESDEKKIQGHQDAVRLYRQLVDLRGEGSHFSPVVKGKILPPLFRPTRNTDLLWGSLMSWCDKFEMESVKSRLKADTLW